MGAGKDLHKHTSLRILPRMNPSLSELGETSFSRKGNKLTYPKLLTNLRKWCNKQW